MQDSFNYSNEKFADIQMLRYRLKGFDNLTTKQKALVYFLAKATLAGRDITTDQFGFYNIKIRKTLEAIYKDYKGNRCQKDFKQLEIYLKRIWFSNGIYHHYSCDKFEPGFSENFFREVLSSIDKSLLPLGEDDDVNGLLNELIPIIFNPEVLSKRVNKKAGEDLIKTSACNYYEGVSQAEAEEYYNAKKLNDCCTPSSWGLNTKLIKKNGVLQEECWNVEGKYSLPIKNIIYWLCKASEVAETENQKNTIKYLIEYYESGDVRIFDKYSISWLKDLDGQIDFINGFIEVYGDPIGIKGSWEGIVEYKDMEATKRTQTISNNAQWFEDHSPVDSRFKKKVVKGVTANVVCAAMLGGDEYPSSAIGINLPNADWIRAQYGSKSVTIGNLIEAYDKAAKGNGFLDEFAYNENIKNVIDTYGDITDCLHTDLHECLGHGSGQLLPGIDPDSLKEYGNVIEEARADLFGLYYIADEKLIELGLLTDSKAYEAQYYTYMMNGLMTQLVRINPGRQIEEAHMRNRALIAHWVMENSNGVIELVKDPSRQHKTYVCINDYSMLRNLFAQLLAEIQRIKSEGDYSAAKELVEKYAVNIDKTLHEEVLLRYKELNIAPYKGFINPHFTPIENEEGNIIDVKIDYNESFEGQMLRYSDEYGFM